MAEAHDLHATSASANSQQLQTLFWQQQMREIEEETDFKNHQLPLARIKKIMKSDEDVRMISADAPVLFAKACEMFILELTLRAWIHTDDNRRKTLQRSDIAMAITKTDIFDFLIDIVPRDEILSKKKLHEEQVVRPTLDLHQYYIQALQSGTPIQAEQAAAYAAASGNRAIIDPILLYQHQAQTQRLLQQQMLAAHQINQIHLQNQVVPAQSTESETNDSSSRDGY
eukprot:TRINITY_DN9498_c0_g3_i1.p1 TRINITY_DN9498_c0_g3~~TRINITY_DN9498_c0_g3_i1.p1  ORF type:complete len:227 (-),score=47.44 TRINITY_DN9498_c0_g3_i1:80-760(-)